MGEMSDSDPYRFGEKRMPQWESEYRYELEEFISSCGDLSHVEKFMNFSVFTPRQTIARFLFRQHLFESIVNVPGEIFECGVLLGGGVFTFAHLSAILEPYNAQRKVVGFDTFEGLPSIHQKDKSPMQASKAYRGSMGMDTQEMLQHAARVFDKNRPLNHIAKIEFVRGNVVESIPEYFERNRHSLVSLLYLDMDLYEGTEAALEYCLPRMPKGAIVAFDEFICERWQGETEAFIEKVGARNVKLKRVPYDSYIGYYVI
jgi:Macrocin-O-methyltransferase (TylF)